MSFRNRFILVTAVRRGLRKDIKRPPEFQEQIERGQAGQAVEEQVEIELKLVEVGTSRGDGGPPEPPAAAAVLQAAAKSSAAAWLSAMSSLNSVRPASKVRRVAPSELTEWSRIIRSSFSM